MSGSCPSALALSPVRAVLPARPPFCGAAVTLGGAQEKAVLPLHFASTGTHPPSLFCGPGLWGAALPTRESLLSCFYHCVLFGTRGLLCAELVAADTSQSPGEV